MVYSPLTNSFKAFSGFFAFATADDTRTPFASYSNLGASIFYYLFYIIIKNSESFINIVYFK